MKIIRYSFFVFVAWLSLSGCTDSQTQTAIVIKNCTGSYLRFEDNDFKICNPEIIESYQRGEGITVKIRYNDQCSYDFECYLHFPFEGSVEILEIE